MARQKSTKPSSAPKSEIAGSATRGAGELVIITGMSGSGKASVLKAFEDLGVSAYNGADRLLVSPANLLAAGKIVSVEARHAAYISDLISGGSFADTANSDGLDVVDTPANVLMAAAPFLTSKLDASHLPTN